MEIKEVGLTGVFVVGGALMFSQYGLNDALSEDLRHVRDVPVAERSDYMDAVVAEFADAFDSYGVETDNYVVSGWSEFSAHSSSATFREVVRAEGTVPPDAVAELRDYWKDDPFCEGAEAQMFTDQGWRYTFKFRNADGRTMVDGDCRPEGSSNARDAIS